MDHALPVSRFKCFGDLLRNIESVFGGHGSSLEVASQCLTLDVFEHKEPRSVRFVEAIDGGDVGVVERSQQLGLALEASNPLLIPRHQLGQHLDRDFSIQLGISGKVDLAHATRTQRRDNLVRTEFGACFQAHN